MSAGGIKMSDNCKCKPCDHECDHSSIWLAIFLVMTGCLDCSGAASRHSVSKLEEKVKKLEAQQLEYHPNPAEATPVPTKKETK